MNEVYKYDVNEDAFVLSIINSNEFTLDSAKEVVELRKKLFNNKPHFLISDSTLEKEDSNGISMEVADYMNHSDVTSITRGVAVIVTSSFKRFVANAALMLKRVNTPVKLFNNQEDALEWIEKIKSKELLESN